MKIISLIILLAWAQPTPQHSEPLQAQQPAEAIPVFQFDLTGIQDRPEANLPANPLRLEDFELQHITSTLLQVGDPFEGPTLIGPREYYESVDWTLERNLELGIILALHKEI